MLEAIQSKAKQLKKQILVVYLAYRHKGVKWYKKAFLLLILVYALSPIDLIPDFIPVLGMLDDLVLIPLGIMIAMKLIPQRIWAECREKAESGVSIDSKYKKMGAVIIVFLWIIGLIAFAKGIDLI